MSTQEPPSLSTENIDYLWNIYNTINEWIRFSDTKAAAVLAANGSIVTIALSSSALIAPLLAKSSVFYVLMAIASFFLCVSTGYAIRCLLPNLNVGEPASLIFFAHIATGHTTAEAYNTKVLSKLSTQSTVVSELTHQIWANSKVSWKKYISVIWSMRFLMFTLCVIGLSIFGAAFV